MSGAAPLDDGACGKNQFMTIIEEGIKRVEIQKRRLADEKYIDVIIISRRFGVS